MERHQAKVIAGSSRLLFSVSVAAFLLTGCFAITPAQAQTPNERADFIRAMRPQPTVRQPVMQQPTMRQPMQRPTMMGGRTGGREMGGIRGGRDYARGGRDYGHHGGFGRGAALGVGLGVAGAVLPLLMQQQQQSGGAAYVDDDYADEQPVLRQRRRPREVEPRRTAEPRRQPPRQPPVQQAAAPRGPSGMPPAGETRFVPDEVMFETRPGVTAAAVTTIAQRYRLTRIGEQRFSLIDTTIYRYRVPQNTTVRGTIAALEGDARIAFVQPNYMYALQQQAEPAKTDENAPALSAAEPEKADTVAVKTEPQPASAPEPLKVAPAPESPKPAGPPQYVVDALHLSDAHLMARGDRTLVAVIDSGIDGAHQELAGAVAKNLDTLGDASPEPEAHGTGMAGAIVAHSLLQSVAPNAQILAARAFSSTGKGGAQGTSFHIAKGVDWAYDEKARIINMSFAGPKDPLLTRMLAAAAQKKMILIAAAGNAGPNSPPLYPAADPNVIAVTATDASNQLYSGANRGAYIGVAAPGVDVLVAAPKGNYEFTTGTSVATAHVSGVIALMLEKYPALDAASIRRALTDSGVALSAANDNVARLADPAAALRKLAGTQQAKTQ